MKYQVTMMIKPIKVEAANEDDAIQAAWELVMENPSKRIKAQAVEVA